MKRVFFVTLAAVMTLAACKKDVEKPQPKVFDPFDDRAVEARIKEFNQKLQQKSGEPMTIEDAVWCIEAALNYNYCRADVSEHNSIIIDSLTISVPLLNSLLLFENIVNAYNEGENFIKNKCLSEKGICKVVDLSFHKDSENVILKYLFISSFYLENSKDIHYTTAANLITQYILSQIPSGYYYTDITSIPVYATWYSAGINPNWDGQYLNYYYYLMFENCAYFPMFHEYLSDQELEFYKINTLKFLNTPTTQGGPKPDEKYLASCKIESRRIFCHGTLSEICHCASPATYGIRHLSPPNN